MQGKRRKRAERKDGTVPKQRSRAECQLGRCEDGRPGRRIIVSFRNGRQAHQGLNRIRRLLNGKQSSTGIKENAPRPSS
jgi:hypothetical protein